MKALESFAYRISSRSRARKFAQFLGMVKPESHETILDVGVNDEEYSEGDNYLEKHYSHLENITAVSKESLEHFAERYPKVKAVIADGTKLPFTDNQFDIVYSNAVIEHVGDQAAQAQLLKELFRIAKRGYLTTPNRYFPIEIHTRVPLLHLLLPKSAFDRFLRLIGKEWATGDYMHLLSRTNLQTLLDEAKASRYQIISNRFLGFTMTFTIIWNKNLINRFDTYFNTLVY